MRGGGTVVINVPKWFDIIKFTISEIIPRFAILGFFLLSSILLYRKSFTWFENIKKKTKTVLIPYLIMNTIWILIFYICQHIPILQSFFSNENNIVARFDTFDWLAAFGIGAKCPFLIPLWFLRNLFIYNLLAIPIKQLIDRFPRTIFFVLTGLYFFTSLDYTYIRIVELYYWCLGYYVVKYDMRLTQLDKLPKIPIIVLYCILVIFRIKTYLIELNIPLISIVAGRMLYIMSNIIWFSFFTQNTKGRLQSFLFRFSVYSFGIYIFHEMALGFCFKLITRILGPNFGIQLLAYLIIPILIISGCIVLCWGLDRQFPSVYKILTGNRMQNQIIHPNS